MYRYTSAPCRNKLTLLYDFGILHFTDIPAHLNVEIAALLTDKDAQNALSFLVVPLLLVAAAAAAAGRGRHRLLLLLGLLLLRMCRQTATDKHGRIHGRGWNEDGGPRRIRGRAFGAHGVLWKIEAAFQPQGHVLLGGFGATEHF